MKALNAQHAFREMRVERDENRRLNRLAPFGKPEAMRTTFSRDQGVKPIFGSSANSSQGAWIDRRSDIESVWRGHDDNGCGEKLRLPNRVGGQGRTRRIGRER